MSETIGSDTGPLDGGSVLTSGPITRHEEPAVQSDQTVFRFAHLRNGLIGPGDMPDPYDYLVAQVRFRVANTGHASRTGHLWLHFGDLSKMTLSNKASQAADLAPSIGHRFDAPCGTVGDSVRYLIPVPQKGTVRQHDELAPPDGSENFLWAHPALAVAGSARALFSSDKWHNSGGDRT
jgi:hypothetical protein